MQGIDDTILTAEAEYSIDFTKHEKKNLFKPILQWKQQLFICSWSLSSSHNHGVQSRRFRVICISNLFRKYFKRFFSCKFDRNRTKWICS